VLLFLLREERVMRAWLHPALEALSRGDAAMLVHVVELKGSGPREPGAQMLVTDSGFAGTIGGGELERSAILTARELLHSGSAGVVTLALGPALNQCCGGSVTLAFEPFAPADLAWLKKLIRAAEEPEPIFRTLSIDAAGGLRRDWETGADGAEYAATLTSPSRGGRNSQAGLSAEARRAKAEGAANFGRGAGTKADVLPPPETDGASLAGFDLPSRGRLKARAAAGTPSGQGLAVNIRERVNPPAQALWLFGAGHVGRALVPALKPLGFAITWIDGRGEQFPEPPLAGVRQLALAMPELAVDEAPPGTIFLVMTHSHPLDEAVCEAVLRREDFAYLGLIGSQTKRARFIRRLSDAGIPAESLKRLTCPIGLAGIASKEPAAIAASVAADLLIRREARTLSSKETELHGR
jgi:xanthine dehydrogenase accessory factor